MKIKSLTELAKLRDSVQSKIEFRETGTTKDDKIDILIGMATCGIASGARDTYNALQELIDKNNIKNVNLVSVGCIGYCYMEPTVQVSIPGREPVVYGKITEAKAKEFFEKVIVQKGFLEEDLVITAYEKAGR
jgi:NADP-reducing hydrogenase subunit HndB